MATYEHLPLRRLVGSLPRRKHGFGRTPDRDPRTHGARIEQAIDSTIDSFNALPSIEGVDPSLILKVTAASFIPEKEWVNLGMVLLSNDGDNSVVLFADNDALQKFKSHVKAYKGGIREGQKSAPYSNLVGAVDNVGLLEPADRIGLALRLNGINQPLSFADDEEYLLDIELHYPPVDTSPDLYLYRLRMVVEKAGGRILSTYNGLHILLARIEGPGSAIRAALELPEVAKIDLPPSPDFFDDDIAEAGIADVTAGAAPAPNSIVIGIIDSGVNFGHPLLQAAEAGSISFDPSGSVADERGHGTQVASIAAFGDIAQRAASNSFEHQFRIASARVLDSRGAFLRDRTMADLMDSAIRELHRTYNCRIFNISLGDEKRPYTGGKIDTWPASLDQLARELNLIIVVSAGNRNDLTASFADRIEREYPSYLPLEGSRIIEPATAAVALTVGAIAHSNGIEEDDIDYVGVRSICNKDEPSPFTRCGPGIKGTVKPELVDFGGTVVWDGPSDQVVSGSLKKKAGIWGFSHKPIERLFVSRSGTSLSAPNVAYKAALLLERFPDAPANLIRALLGLSASLPPAPRERINGLSKNDLHQVCGHGVANAIHAATSDDSRVVLYAKDEIDLDKFALFEVPIPTEFQTTKGTREIRVSLAFDPPTRHTRVDYFGVTMGWRLLRGSTIEEVNDRFRKWHKDEGDPPEFEDKFLCETFPGPGTRDSGTLQVGTYRGLRNISRYGDKYYVAVWALRRWAPIDEKTQKFAIAVQLRHENVNTLYNRLRQPIRV